MAKNNQDTPKEETKGESFLSFPDTQIYYKSMVIIVRLYWYRDRQINQLIE